MNPVYAAMGTSIFEEMSTAARAHGAINLGQGFPETEGPDMLRRAAADALLTRSNQYPPMLGLPELRQAVADHYHRHQSLDLAPEQVVVTAGATEALAAAMLALIAPGDEVALIQPMYDAYLPLVLRAGGVPRFITLQPPAWRVTAEAVAAAIGPATRLLVVNTPLNPLGRMLDGEELALLAAACIEHDVIAVCDEVWEHVRFDGRAHLPLMGLPGMAARTVKIGSAGKIFSMTGWKVGWAIAAPPLLAVLARAHQYLTFTVPPALQWAVAAGLGEDGALLEGMRAGYQRARDRLGAALAAGGWAVLPAEATYFLNLDLAASGIAADDHAFCRRMVEEAGVAAIPVSAFYAEAPVRSVVRLCFAKGDAVLDEAAARLNRMRRALVDPIPSTV